ncbi:MAG: hypothetical protein AB1779_05790 [Candidatus Thermoplasmatota archaeon]
MKKNNEAVGEFLIDITSLLIVIITLGVFLWSLYQSAMIYGEHAKRLNINDEAYNLCRVFRSYEKILVKDEFGEPIEGVFNGSLVGNLTETDVTGEINSNYPFSISISDLEENITWNYGDVKNAKEVAKVSAVICIDWGERVNIGKLIVAVWLEK